MILTDYYRFEKVAHKSKMRLDCTASTKSYTMFEQSRATKPRKESEKFDAINIGDLIVYFGNVPNHFGGDVHRKTDKSITIKGNNLSSIFVPDPSLNFGYGDVRGTSDAIMLVFHSFDVNDGKPQHGAILEIFVARGKSKDRMALYTLMCDGELDEEMEYLRKRAQSHGQSENSGASPEN